ncbi:hypothetical protein AIOL_001366 [Candidatus Rhodobacter oscarellae]|uniref:Uncharacterized protein n=1 Tax=Candidatus Rhodobacter oscarellae TaxID=1675527 RepID=A0A0J9E147_9RHOB|nr:hypothetical protein AIOL_001366 [Candidatus Rhodobacter lobularis]
MDGADAQLHGFATCAGRLSALMEHQWMFDGAASEETEHSRALVIDILDAMMPADRGRDVLSWRIEAKVAHSALLTRASFAQEPRDRIWAARTALRLTEDCQRFLLG